MRRHWIFILLLCVGLSAAALTGCSFKDSDSQNKELADCFLTEFLTINSDGRNDELMAKLQNNSELFTDEAVLKDAFAATCKKRGTDHLQEQAEEIIKIIEADEQLRVLWRAYQKKYSYAAEIDYASVISGVRKLMDWIR